MIPDAALLEVRDLHKSFGGNRAVDGVSFTLQAGELLALIGPNGAGKTTTFNIVGGQLRADSGEIRFDGQPLPGRRPRDVWRRGIGRTFQIAETFASLTVVENVQTALLSAAGQVFNPWRSAALFQRDVALALLAQVGMHTQADRPCSELAYGDVKRVELAIALAGAPKLLLMDEPTAGMAPAERHALMALTKALVRERRIAVLFTEHSMDVVFTHADRVLVLARGRLIAQGSPQQVRDDPQAQAAYFGAGTVFDHPRSGLAFAGVEPSTGLVLSGAAPQGGNPRGPAEPVPPRPLDAAPRAGDAQVKAPLLDVKALNAWYGAAQVLFGVDLQVQRGEVVALMGRNGAGKSTTLKALMGLVERRSDGMRFMGRDMSRAGPHDMARAGLGFVPEDRRIFTDLTVRENLSVGRQPPRHWPDGSAAPAWTDTSLYQLFPNLGEMPGRAGGQMSGGEQQMLTVARTLMGNPFVLLLDEPSEGVAPLIVEQMARTIATLKSQGVSVLLSEQNLHFAALVADRVLVLEKGQVRYTGTMQELAADEAARRAYLSF